MTTATPSVVILEVKDPVWADAAHTAINVMINTDMFGWIPFTASPADPSGGYGPEIYENALNGDYGDIAEYVEPQD